MSMATAKRPEVAHERLSIKDIGAWTAGAKTQSSILSDIDEVRLTNVWFYDKDGTLILGEKTTRDVYNRILSTKDGLRYAKVEFYSDGSKKTFIKVYSGGRQKGEYIVDPNTFEGNAEELSRTNDHYGTRLCEYAPVNEDIFAQYTFYLKTKNPSRIKDVERKYLDGR